MGLFDKLTGSGSSKLTPKSALALAALTMIGADGSVDDGGLQFYLKGERVIELALSTF